MSGGYLYLHYYFNDVFAIGIWDDGAINGIAIECDLFHALLLAIGMDVDDVLGIAELTGDGVILSRLRETGINTDAVVVGLNTEDKLTDGVPHPSGGTSEP